MSQGQQFPAPNEPIAGPGGMISTAWFLTLNSLWRKASGGTVTGSGTAGRLAKWLTSSSLTDALAAASSKLLGSGSSGSGAPYSEITLGTGLSMTGTTLNATGTGGTVTTTGSPASGNLTKFSGAATITNGDLSGDVTTSGTLATTLAASGVAAATYGDATHVAQVAVDTKGRVTSASNVAITATGTVTHSAGALTANELVVGNGGADLKTVAATNGQIPIGKTSDGSVTLATIGAGANITVTNGPGSVIIAATAGAGGTGNSIYTGVSGGEPGSPNTGDVYLPSNGFWQERYGGAAWVPWGPIFPFTDPTLQSFSWDNQGGASVSTTNGGIYLSAPAVAGTNLRVRYKSAPATPYTVTVAFLANLIGTVAPVAGLVFRESGSGKLVSWHVEGDSAGPGIYVSKWNSATSFNTAYPSMPVDRSHGGAALVWLRIADNGTNRICSISTDGQNFIACHTIGRTDFLTADQVGFFASPNTSSFDAGMTLLSWKEA